VVAITYQVVVRTQGKTGAEVGDQGEIVVVIGGPVEVGGQVDLGVGGVGDGPVNIHVETFTLRKLWRYLPCWAIGLLRLSPPLEWMLWIGDGSGEDQVGREVNIGGRTGKVVDGTILKILVKWDI
jgi:hypothetical protein